jgi:hypothetical protein
MTELSKYRPPKTFVAVYRADECGEEFLMENLFVPKISFLCEECNSMHDFKIAKIIHTSWEWDVVEDEHAE